jgi:DNA-directed RNA polymerase subunit K/omega
MARLKDKDIQNLPSGDGRYMMINITARRARQLNRERSHGQFDESMFDALDIALTEYRNGKIHFDLESVAPGTVPEDYRTADA